MTSKLALHYQGYPDNDGTAGARWVKGMSLPRVNPWGVTRCLHRVYFDDATTNALIWEGAAGARKWVDMCLPYWQDIPWAHACELPNEPQPVFDLAFCRALAEFTGYAADCMRALGYRSVGGNISEGNPGGNEAERRERMVIIGRGLVHCDYWSQHCYWVPDGHGPESGITVYHALRYRLNQQYMREAGLKPPPILITEFGCDGGIVGRPKTGHKDFYPNEAAYMVDVARFDTELGKDPDVLAATMFTSRPNGDWTRFEVTPTLYSLIAQHIASCGGPYVGEGMPVVSTFTERLSQAFGSKFSDIHATLPRGTAAYATRSESAVKRVVVHHTATSAELSWKTIAQYHVNQGWPGIGYHIGIGMDGSVGLLNPLTTISYHCGSLRTPEDDNADTIGIVLAGNFVETQPTAAALYALRRVVEIITAHLGRALPVIGHMDIAHDTECPGTKLEEIVVTQWGPGPVIILNPLGDFMLSEGDAHQVIQHNPDAALQKRIDADGFVSNSPEFATDYQGVKYTAQRAERLDNGTVRVYYCITGAWDNVMYAERPA